MTSPKLTTICLHKTLLKRTRSHAGPWSNVQQRWFLICVHTNCRHKYKKEGEKNSTKLSSMGWPVIELPKITRRVQCIHWTSRQSISVYYSFYTSRNIMWNDVTCSLAPTRQPGPIVTPKVSKSIQFKRNHDATMTRRDAILSRWLGLPVHSMTRMLPMKLNEWRGFGKCGIRLVVMAGCTVAFQVHNSRVFDATFAIRWWKGSCIYYINNVLFYPWRGVSASALLAGHRHLIGHITYQEVWALSTLGYILSSCSHI